MKQSVYANRTPRLVIRGVTWRVSDRQIVVNGVGASEVTQLDAIAIDQTEDEPEDEEDSLSVATESSPSDCGGPDRQHCLQ